MSWIDVSIIIAAGFVAGFFNIVAGGGSLLTLPVLIFLGLPSADANATNRVAIFLQNITGVVGFRTKGVGIFGYTVWLALSALAGAIVGAKIAVDIDDALFNKLLAVVMIVVVLFTVFNPFSGFGDRSERLSFRRRAAGAVIFFFVGVYGGFIQAGVGFLIIAALAGVNNFSLIQANSAKVFIILVYTSAALIVFIFENKVNWTYGLVLSLGNMTGAWIASRLSVKKGDQWIKRFLLVAVAALAVKLWFF